MPLPQSYAGAVANIITGQHVVAAAGVQELLGVNVPCRRILLVAGEGDVVYIGAQDHTSVIVGMIVPAIRADGSYVPLELWVNNVSVIYVVGAGGQERIFWLAEQF